MPLIFYAAEETPASVSLIEIVIFKSDEDWEDKVLHTG